jgi:hypothetical protein
MHYSEPVSRSAPEQDFRDFEAALQTLSERVRSDEEFAHDLYSALCNMQWRRRGTDGSPIAMSWRYAGGLVAHLACNGGDYLAYYCSGGEGKVARAVEEALARLGWEPVPWPD